MTIKNCTRCGRVFQAVGNQKLCSRCRSTDDEDFKVVREYVYDNPEAAIKDIAEETGVSEKQILKFLRAGKLILKGENSMVLDCERCGKAIKTGRYCDECANQMARELKSAFAVPKESVKESTETKNTKGFYSSHKSKR